MSETYNIERADEPGNIPWWKIVRDGRSDGHIYRSPEKAAEIAERQNEYNRMGRAIEAEIGQDWRYGIRLESETTPGQEYPTWRITDQHIERDKFAISWDSHDPMPVYAYTRGQYERACAAAGLDPVADSDLGTYGDRYFHINLWEYEAAAVVEHELRKRRIAGIEREAGDADKQRVEQLIASGLNITSYTRDQYERACEILQVQAVDDSTVAAIVVKAEARRRGSYVINTIPTDELAAELALRRVAALLEESGETCDECGVKILPGYGMSANLGLACSDRCYHAMSDRPGRAASKAARHPQ